jgi:hypothetical protein
LKQSEVAKLIDELILAGCLEQTDVDRFRPILQLTELGSAVMRGQKNLEASLALPPELVRKLKGTAKAEEKQVAAPPEARVASDSAKSQPDEAPPHDDARQRAYNEAAARPQYYWTWRLLATGISPAECAVIRGIEPGVVLDHALRAVEAGLRVEATWFLSPELLQKMQTIVGDADPQRIRPLLAKLPRGTRYEEVLLFVKCRPRSEP